MGGHRQVKVAARSNFDVNLKRYVTNVLKWRPEVSVLMAHVCALFRNKRFALNKMFQQNASKFTIFYV